MCRLVENYDIDKGMEYINSHLDHAVAIKEKLVQAFPGAYGMHFSMHFGPFLKETLGSAKKQKAYNEIVHFLDHLTITKEMENDLEHIIPLMEAEDVENIHSTIQDAIDDTDKYIMNHQKELEAYMVFRTSESYQSTPAYKMQQLLMEFQQNSGYYEIFIANLKIISRRLSRVYRKTPQGK
ncbi:hypothetical protein FE784_34280 [Paenibacillus hemerocallicola]|uniref:Uncharacterized protein n=1 Tax=Paenibacillus hemerocallicola TaxID=1172614 RepID=A0A5C4SZ32_9BACL|nr:hypothetical protein [Paenibacillus hemerocallicola]TNJ61545.1 hypothetical protein FE784_34280 [Paenibacillus hemerocallicola]